MEAQYKTLDGRLTFKITAESPRGISREISQLFDADESCGCCGGKLIDFLDRLVNDCDKVKCSNCRARLQLGQAKKGDGLLAKRKDEQVTYQTLAARPRTVLHRNRGRGYRNRFSPW
jgi:hypothetical protein